jgi:NAD(P)-dependent dehydrogenase (short-subunit alcohol dehydrogenase family)
MASSSQVAIVTGGNSGMGAALARDLVKRGWKVAVADIQENQELAKELGEGASFFKCNVADYDRCVCFEALLPGH